MGTKIFMKLHSNFYNLTAADNGQFKKELPYVMNGKMKLLLTEFAVPAVVTLLESGSESPKDKALLLTTVSYLNK